MPGLDDVDMEYIDSLDKAMECKRWLGEQRIALGVDVETTGLNPYEPGAAIRLIQFGDQMRGWAMSWDLWKGLALEILNSWEGDFVGHNIGAFDSKWIEHHSAYRFPRHRLHDTMLQAHIIDPLGSGALKTLSCRLIDGRADNGQKALNEAMRKNKWTWATVPVDFEAYHAYGALDPVLTTRLHEKFMKRVGPGTEWHRVYDLELAVRNVVSRMERRGIRVDTTYSEQKSAELLDYAERMRVWGRTHYGINIGSGPKLVELFERLGGEFTVYSKTTGAPSVDKYQLKIFAAHESPEIAQLARTVLNYRRAAKFGGDYFGNFITSAIVEPDGYIVHASVRTLGARTGRMSITAPALQTIPKQNSTVRDAFIPREGNVLVTTDYSQIEMRLMAHFSEDKDLQKAFSVADETGGDFFVEIGKDVYNDPGFSKSDKRRGLIKNVSYGKAYGAGIAKMAESAGVPYEQMAPVSQSIDTRYPGLKRFMKKVEHEGVLREKKTGQGFINTPSGRRLPCDDGKVYTLVNYLLQSTAAEEFKKAIVALDAAGWGDAMVIPIHDEILMDLPAEDAEQALHDVPKIMENVEDYAVPLLAESDGPFDRWGTRYR